MAKYGKLDRYTKTASYSRLADGDEVRPVSRRSALFLYGLAALLFLGVGLFFVFF